MSYRSYRTQQRALYDAMMKRAKEAGLKVYHVRIRFTNDDVPKFLKKLDKIERESRESKLGNIMCCA